MNDQSMTYASAGVNIDLAGEAKARIKKLARQTFNKHVLGEFGSFGGLFRLDVKKYKNPVLVSSADGVGTKLKIAFMTGRHNSVGADLVNHCVNDILVEGAFPLFFLDYIAMGRMDPNVVEQLAKGLTRACQEAGCVLIGGETAEMPDFYRPGEYDLAGCIIGLADQPNLITGRTIKPGDILLGLPSLGLHTNGYSLARKIVFGVLGLSHDRFVAELNASVGEALLAPHRSYLPTLKDLIIGRKIKGLAHITGGGITHNLPRILPAQCRARIHKDRWPIPPIFRYLQRQGQVPEDDMYRTFNMGIGMIIVISARDLSFIEETWRRKGEVFYNLGEIVKGPPQVKYV